MVYLPRPLLLLSPDGSRDRVSDPVVPTVGGTVPIVAGQYGDAWEFTVANAGRLTIPLADHIESDAGTILVRFKPYATAASSRFILNVGQSGAATGEWLSLDLSSASARTRWRHGLDAIVTGTVSATTAGTWDTYATRWDGTAFQSRLESVGTWHTNTRTAPYAAFSGTNIVTGAFTTANQLDGAIESILVFKDHLTDAQVAELTDLDAAWTWDLFGDVVAEAEDVAAAATIDTAHNVLPVSLPTAHTMRTPHLLVTIDGQLIDALSADTHHGVDRPKGTATVTALRPASTETELRDRWINKTIEIQAGYDETGGARRIFSGRVAQLRRDWDGRGTDLQIVARGWASILDFPAEDDLEYGADASLYDVIRSLCQLRGVPQFGGELITYMDGVTPVTLGGVAEVDEGKVVIPRRTSPLQWITQKTRLFGYRAFDRPDGFFWWQMVSGEPAAGPVMTFAQADNVVSIGRDDDIDGTVTWWDVEGARYTDADGVQVQVHSFPAVVPPYPFDPPPDFVRDEIRDGVLVTQALADAARNAAEDDYAGPFEIDRWSFLGENDVQPGEIVSLTASVLELSAVKRWVMTTDHSISDRGYTTDWTGWAGSGTPVASGDDSDEVSVLTTAQHIGDETLSHYAHPVPQGTELSFSITVPDTYTSLALIGYAHGCNSYLLGGVNTDSEVSKIEVWQGGERVGSGTLPMMPENLAQRLDYDIDSNWIRFRIPVPGRLETGTATVKFISGEDRRIADQFAHDDYEVRDTVLELRGVGYPALPSGGG